jgi:hypothetical protein
MISSTYLIIPFDSGTSKGEKGVKMFCPKCRAEYREGFTSCSDCHIPLVPELGPAPVLLARIRAEKATSEDKVYKKSNKADKRK